MASPFEAEAHGAGFVPAACCDFVYVAAAVAAGEHSEVEATAAITRTTTSAIHRGSSSVAAACSLPSGVRRRGGEVVSAVGLWALVRWGGPWGAVFL